jgi:hypothetical protein
MATTVQKVLVSIEANDAGLKQLQASADRTFQQIAVSAKTSTAGVDAIAKRIALLTTGSQLDSTKADALKRLTGVEAGLREAIQKGDLTLSERVKLEELLARAATPRVKLELELAAAEKARAKSATDAAAAEKRLAAAAAESAAVQRAAVKDSLSTAAQKVGLGGVTGGVASTLGALTGSLPVAGVILLGASLAKAGLEAVTMGQRIEASLAQVARSVPAGKEGIDALRQAIVGLSLDTGRSQEELARAAAEIARLGVGSASEVASRLKAATTAADASGEDLTAVITGLDATLDVFGISSAHAGETLAKMFNAARGHQPLTELFDQVRAAAPALNRLHIDLGTGVRALVALGEQTGKPKQAAAELLKYGEAGAAGRREIEKLAGSIGPLNTSLDDMTRLAKDANDQIGKTSQKLRNEFSAALIGIGDTLLPKVNIGLQTLLGIAQTLHGEIANIDAGSALGTVASLGRLIDTIPEHAQKGGKGFRDLIRATQDFINGVHDGNIELEKLSGGTLKALETSLSALMNSQRVGQPLKQAIEPILNGVRIALANAKDATATLGAATAAANAAGSAGGRAGTGRKTADELIAEQKALEAQLRVRQELQALLTAGTKSPVDDLEAKLVKFREDATKAGLGAGEIAAGVAKIQAQVDKLRSDKITELTEAIEKETAAFAASQTDTIAAASEKLVRHFQEQLDATVGLSAAERDLKQAQIDRLQVASRGSIIAIRAIEDANRAIRGIIDPLQNASADQLGELGDVVESLRATLVKLRTDAKGAFDVENTKAYLDVVEKIRSIEEQRRSIAAAIGNQIEKETKEVVDALEKEARARKINLDLLRQSTDATKAAIDEVIRLAEEFGVIPKEVGAIFDNLLKIGPELELFAKTVKDFKSGETVNGKPIASLGDVLKSALPLLQGIGALVGVMQQVFATGPSPEQLAAQRQNTESLERLTKNVGDLVGVSASGRQLGAAQTVVAALDPSKLNPFGKAGLNGPLEFFNTLRVELAKTGLTMAEFKEIAKSLGFDLTNITEKSFAAFKKALLTFDLHAFLDTFAGNLAALDESAKVFKQDDPIKALQDLIAVLTGDNGLGGAAKKAFDGLDLTTIAGRAEATARAQELYKKALDGTITTEELGGLSLDQYREAMVRVIGALDEATIAAKKFGDATGGLQDEFAVFDITDPAAQFDKFKETLGKLSPAFKDFFAGIDLTTKEGTTSAKKRLQDLFTRNRAGELTDAERGGLSQADFEKFLVQIDGFFDQIFAGFTDAEDKAAQKAEADRKARNDAVLKRAGQDIDIKNLSPDDAFRAQVAAWSELSPALKEFFGQFDLSTTEGIKAARAAIADWYDRIQKGEVVTGLGSLTMDEFTDGILGLASAADTALGAVTTLAEKMRNAFSDIDFKIQIEGVTDPAQKAQITAQGLKGLFPGIDAILAGVDLTDPGQRRKAIDALVALGESTKDKDLQQAALQMVNTLRAIPDAVSQGVQDAASGAGAGGSSGEQITQSAVATLTERTGIEMLDILRAIHADTFGIYGLAKAWAGLFGASGTSTLGDAIAPRLRAPAGLLTPPALPSQVAAAINGGSGNLSIGSIEVGPFTIQNLPPGISAKQLADMLTDQLIVKLADKVDAKLGPKLLAFRRWRGGMPS